jgi:thioredoxin reductase
MIFECAIIGGGPAGLSAAQVLGRARKSVIVCDDNRPRNAVTQRVHSFLTRDGIDPRELRRIAHEEITSYPSVTFRDAHVTSLEKNDATLRLTVQEGETIEAKTIILATGLKEVLPQIKNIDDFYGKSLSGCAWCEGWELRDKALVLITESDHILHMAKLVYNWSQDLLICTNGHEKLTHIQKQELQHKGIAIIEQPITELIGKDGQLEQVVFQDGTTVRREAGFVGPQWVQATNFGAELGCAMNAMNAIAVDPFGRTSVKGVYAAGDATFSMSLITATAEGYRAGTGVYTDLIYADFDR